MNIQKHVVFAVVFAFSFVIAGQAGADEEKMKKAKKNNDIKHIEKPFNLTVKSKDGTVKAGVVNMPATKVHQRGNATIVDRSGNTGVGVTWKFK